MSSWIGRLRQQGLDTVNAAQAWADTARDRSAAVDAGLFLIHRFRFLQTSLIAGYVALRLFVLLFPLAYLVVAGIGLSTSASESRDVTEQVGVGGAVADSIADAASASDRSHWIALVIGLMATAWAGRGTLRAVRIAFAEGWRLPAPKTSYASTGGLLLAAIVLGSMAWGGVIVRLRENGWPIVGVGLLHAAVMFAAALGIAFLLPRGAGTRWQDLAPGALLVAVAAPALSIAVSVYFAPRLSRTAATYGAIGTGVVIIAYLLAVGWLISLSAELNGGLYEWRQQRRFGGPPASTEPPVP
jgi:uncharacterized BrkB/YihY/UPF0761 family membrane protein